LRFALLRQQGFEAPHGLRGFIVFRAAGGCANIRPEQQRVLIVPVVFRVAGRLDFDSTRSPPF
jgi:hypothetical protein